MENDENADEVNEEEEMEEDIPKRKNRPRGRVGCVNLVEGRQLEETPCLIFKTLFLHSYAYANTEIIDTRSM